MTNENTLEKISKECKRIEEDTLHSFKSHYNSADFWSKVNLGLGLPAALSGMIAGGSSSVQFNDALTTGAALIASALTICLTFLKPSEKSDSHKNAGNLYQALRNKARIFREVELTRSENIDQVLKDFNSLAARRDELNTIMPSISRAPYEKAKEDIDEGRAVYQVDKE